MVVPTDVQVSFIAGALLADLGARVIEARKDQSPEALRDLYCRYRLRALIYPSIFVGPSATAFMLGWPAWETQYWSASFEHTADNLANALPFGVFLLLLFVAAWLGNWLGFHCVVKRARGRLRATYLAVLAATLAIVALKWPAPIRLGCYDEFHADPEALPYIWQDAGFFVGFCAISLYCAVPLLVWLIQIRKSVRRLS